jgi:hypothetical protein
VLETIADIPVPRQTTKIIMLLGKQPKDQKEARRLIIQAYKPGKKPKK